MSDQGKEKHAGTSKKSRDQGNDSILQYAENTLSGEDPYADKLNAGYIKNLLGSVSSSSKIAYKICSSMEEVFQGEIESADLSFPAKKKDDDETYYHTNKKQARKPVLKQDWKTLQGYFSRQYEDLPQGEEPLALQNLKRLAGYLGLGALEKELLEFSYVTETDLEMQDFFTSFLENDKGGVSSAIACMLGKPEKVKEIHKALSSGGGLISYGLVIDKDEFALPNDRFVVPKIDLYFKDALAQPDMGEEDIMKVVLGEARSGELELDDFSYRGENLEFIVNLVENAVKQGLKGVNILLYGPPGSGKTVLAEAIADHVGVKMYSAGENEGQDNDFDMDYSPFSTTSDKRISSLLQMQAILKGNKDTVLLFDEIEDLFLKGTDTSKSSDTESKIQINRLLENNEVVTIWTGNDPEKFHEAVRQRFTMSLHMGYPPTKIRQKIWERQLGMQKVDMDSSDTLALARKYQAPPRMIAKASRAASITSSDAMEAIERSLESDARLARGGVNEIMGNDSVSSYFDLSLVNAGDDTEDHVNEMIERGKCRKPFSLLVKGRQGSGLSSVLRHMGEEMTMSVLEVPMGALMQETPFSTPAQNIQNAFNGAANEGAFLIVHDVDQIVLNPESSTAEWNGGLVQLFNQCMDRHELPFAVTTGMELPEIFTHRFSEKMKLKALSEGQARKACEIYFGTEMPSQLAMVDGLLPGDFASVSRLLENKGKDFSTPDKILELLEQQKKFRGSQSTGMKFVQS